MDSSSIIKVDCIDSWLEELSTEELTSINNKINQIKNKRRDNKAKELKRKIKKLLEELKYYSFNDFTLEDIGFDTAVESDPAFIGCDVNDVIKMIDFL